MRHLPLNAAALIISQVAGASAVEAQGCLAPPRPFVPSDPAAAREYADLIRTDFETYLSDVQSYFLCLDIERARAIDQAREVAEEYARFIEMARR